MAAGGGGGGHRRRGCSGGAGRGWWVDLLRRRRRRLLSAVCAVSAGHRGKTTEATWENPWGMPERLNWIFLNLVKKIGREFILFARNRKTALGKVPPGDFHAWGNPWGMPERLNWIFLNLVKKIGREFILNICPSRQSTAAFFFLVFFARGGGCVCPQGRRDFFWGGGGVRACVLGALRFFFRTCAFGGTAFFIFFGGPGPFFFRCGSCGGFGEGRAEGQRAVFCVVEVAAAVS